MIDNYIIRDGSILKRLIRFLESTEFKTLCDDKAMEVLIRPYKENKTREQENFFHLLCGILGDKIGFRKGETKALVKAYIIGQKTVECPGERTITVPMESSSLPKDEYSELIEGCYEIGAFHGVQLPAPRYSH